MLWMGKLGTEWLQQPLPLAEGIAGQEQRGPGLGTRAFSLMCWWWFHFAIRAQRIQRFLCTLHTLKRGGTCPDRILSSSPGSPIGASTFACLVK